MSDRQRRSSLLDQMALAAAALDSDDLDSDDDDDDDDDSEGGMGMGAFPSRRFGLEALPEGPTRESMPGDESDDFDEFENLGYDTMGMDYGGWNPTLDTVTDESVEVGLEEEDDDDGLEKYGYESMNMNVNVNEVTVDPNRVRRSSYRPPSRRTSHAESEGSFNSAPARAGLDAASPLFSSEHSHQERRRPLSIAVPNAEGAENSRRLSSARRSSVKVRNASSGSMTSYSTDEDTPSRSSGSGSGLMNAIRARKRRSTRRQNLSIAKNSGGSGTKQELEAAIEVFKNQDANNEWENVAAAAAVVSASVSGEKTSKRNQQFAINETVLVNLTLLNVTAEKNYPKDRCTIAPVNAYGFPDGEGHSDGEKCGPYSYVLSTVKHAHFDEDARYYTIIRADTGTEQRADSNWMESLRDPVAIESAYRAAGRTVQSTQDKPEETGAVQRFTDFFWIIGTWPLRFCDQFLVPYYRRQRTNLKIALTKLLFGDAPFACKIRITAINLLVLCSFSFLFLELVNLAFLPANLDYAVTIAGVVIWGILAMELLFEAVIRPQGYDRLITSDKAFAPSTARHINTFHLFFETMALLTFIPEFDCFLDMDVCIRDGQFSRVQASLDSITGGDNATAAKGRAIIGLTALRLFGLVRHWKQMWINNSFSANKPEGFEKWLFRQEKLSEAMRPAASSLGKQSDDDVENDRSEKAIENSKPISEEDRRLKSAATIGTALMVVNSHRALILLVTIVIVLPIINSLTQTNLAATKFSDLLQANNIAAGNDCEFLENAVSSWVNMAAIPQPTFLDKGKEDTYVLWAQLLPIRCDFQDENGVVTTCSDSMKATDSIYSPTCQVWDDSKSFVPVPGDNSAQYFFATELGLRAGGIREETGLPIHDQYEITVFFNENPSIALSNMALLCLLFGILFLGLIGLQALRSDTIRLVLDPLQRMLKIVLRYAENPLAEHMKDDPKDGDEKTEGNSQNEIGNYETEQLIGAIAKIADLLRKCWGVAGAGIISSNLARNEDGKTVVFNPTVPGKRVYALFGFVAINGFSDQLRALDKDVMILINDVAKVVHDEVYRWALGDSGQCNKNLGAAFLMVFRIGDFTEVHEKKKRATAVVFNNNLKTAGRKVSTVKILKKGGRKRRGGADGDTLQLASLPGIQSFSDRALLGMLKSFAGLHRDNALKKWKIDFRLSAGVSAYSVEVIYGMDAGWAVEGAVGSEYKIDATYLSPHVNMASRMMSATKQYGVTILLSKAVEEIMSRQCRKKLRHLDTVYVKGSKVKQDIFTYDARHRGVDFFLIERTPEQAESDAENYNPTIWDTDPDLRAMRQHVTDKFVESYSMAVKHYLAGKWATAYQYFQAANDIMIETVVTEGYVDYDVDRLGDNIMDHNNNDEEIVRLRNEIGDGACRVLMTYIERRDFVPPANWDAVRPLLSK